jgi:putative peptidoglycan lipid II flippase
MQLFKEYSYKRGAALAIGSTFIWKILSFVNSILIAYYFGTQTRSDVYFYILFIAGIISNFFTSLNGDIIIPQTIYLRKESEKSAQSFLNFFLFLYVIILFIFLFTGELFPVKIFSLFSKFSIEVLIQEHLILRLAFIYFSCNILCSFILNIMYIYRIFSINFLFPLNALMPLLIMLLFHNVLGLKTMLIGFIISYLIQILAGLFIMKKKLNWSFKSFKINFEKKLKDNIITNQSLVIINFFVSILPVYLMSNFAGGIISALSYAKQLTDAPTEILTTKISGIYHVRLNENASSRDFTSLNINYIKVTYIILFIITPLSLFTCYFAPDIINLFFKRGKFNLESSINVVRFLRPLMLLLIINAIRPLAGSIIAGTRKIKECFKYNLFLLIIYIFMFYVFISYFGPFVYPYVEIGGSIIGFLIIALFFKRYIPQINYWQPLKDAVLLVILNLIALIPAAFVGDLLTGQIEFIRIFICGLIFLFTLALLYLPTKQIKRILPSVLGIRYKNFLNKVPYSFKKFI